MQIRYTKQLRLTNPISHVNNVREAVEMKQP